MVEVTKGYYLEILISKLETIFDYDEDDEIEQYLQSNFVGLLGLSDVDYSIIKVAMEEVRETPERKHLISKITSTVIDKLEEYFNTQIEKGKIRNIDSRVLAIMCFGITFQSIMLWKVYDSKPGVKTNNYAKSFLDILYNGIKE